MPRSDYEKRLYLTTPTLYHNHYGLKLWGPPKLIRRFNDVCWREFRPSAPEKAEERRAWGACWQSQSADFLYIEFWMEPTPAAREKVWQKAQEIARELNIPVAVYPK